jgi:hypothetical protein
VVTFQKPTTVMASPPPPFPQQIPQNEESSGFQTVCRKTWVIMLPMTRHKALHTGLASPSPLDRWINALLHAFAMLMSFVARRFASRNQTPAAECDGDCEPVREAMPVLDQHQDPISAAARSQTIQALMVSSVAIATRPSNHEGRLAALSASHPRPCAEDLGSSSGRTRSNPYGLPTGILGTSPRMTRGWARGEQPTARVPH